MLLGDVGLVEDKDHRAAELGHLRSQEEVAEQVRRVGDEHHGVRPSVAGDVAGERVDDDLFVGRGGGERVESGQVDEFDLLAIAEELDRQEEITAIPFELDTAAIAHFHQMIHSWTDSTRH